MAASRLDRPILKIVIPDLWEESPTPTTESSILTPNDSDTATPESAADSICEAEALRLLGDDLMDYITLASNTDITSPSTRSLGSAVTEPDAYDGGLPLRRFGPSNSHAYLLESTPLVSSGNYPCCTSPFDIHPPNFLGLSPVVGQEGPDYDPSQPYWSRRFTVSPSTYDDGLPSGESSPVNLLSLDQEIADFDSWFDHSQEEFRFYSASFLQTSLSSDDSPDPIREESLLMTYLDIVDGAMRDADFSSHETGFQSTTTRTLTSPATPAKNLTQSFEQDLSVINQRVLAENSRIVSSAHTGIHEELSRQIAERVRLALDLEAAVEKLHVTHSMMQNYLDDEVRSFAHRMLGGTSTSASSADRSRQGGSGGAVGGLLAARDCLRELFRNSVDGLAARTSLLDEVHIEDAYREVSRWEERWETLEATMEIWRIMKIDQKDGEKVALVLEIWLDGFY